MDIFIGAFILFVYCNSRYFYYLGYNTCLEEVKKCGVIIEKEE